MPTFAPVFLALLACLLAGCAQNPVTGRSELVAISESQEIAIGRQEDARVTEQEGGLYDDPALQRYVDEVGQRLARASHRPGLTYHFRVIDSPAINAFALPGGYVYITRGILAYLGSEAELAAVLGHEIGHVTARHSVQRLTAAQGASIAATIASIAVPGLRDQAAQGLLNVLGGALLSGYGREQELEADRLGAEYLARTGYDAGAMIRVLEVLKNHEAYERELAQAEGRVPRTYHGLFASHPTSDARLQEIVATAQRLASGPRREEREAFLRRIDRLPLDDSPRQGFVRNGRFYHPELGIAMDLPAGWRVVNRPSALTATGPGQEAVLQLRIAGPARGAPADVLRRSLRLSADTPVVAQPVNGLPAASTRLTLGGRPTRASVLFLGETAYLVAGQARDREAMRTHEAAITRSQSSFREMDQAERRLARPHTLRIVTARPGTTYAELARTSALSRHAEQRLRILNGHYPEGEPVAGQALKIVE